MMYKVLMATLVEICESYNKLKEEEAHRKEFYDIFAESFDKGEVVKAMVKQGWGDYEIKDVLEEVTSKDRAEIAIALINSGKYRYYKVKNILRAI